MGREDRNIDQVAEFTPTSFTVCFFEIYDPETIDPSPESLRENEKEEEKKSDNRAKLEIYAQDLGTNRT